jgi:hypothetical protein
MASRLSVVAGLAQRQQSIPRAEGRSSALMRDHWDSQPKTSSFSPHVFGSFSACRSVGRALHLHFQTFHLNIGISTNPPLKFFLIALICDIHMNFQV